MRQPCTEGTSLGPGLTPLVDESLLPRTRDLRLAPGFVPRHVPSFFVRRLLALELELEPA